MSTPTNTADAPAAGTRHRRRPSATGLVFALAILSLGFGIVIPTFEAEFGRSAWHALYNAAGLLGSLVAFAILGMLLLSPGDSAKPQK